MGTFNKEYPVVVDALQTECDIYSLEGHVFHTDNAASSLSASQPKNISFLNNPEIFES